TTTTTAPNQPNINVLSAQANPTSTLTFGQPNGSTAAPPPPPTTTMLTGQAGLSVQQQINQQAQRN
ncbi:unnamed protein product, partial [Rotaria magnacalcarata]